MQVSAGNIFCLDDDSEIIVQLLAVHAHMITSMCSIVIGYTHMTICICICVLIHKQGRNRLINITESVTGSGFVLSFVFVLCSPLR